MRGELGISAVTSSFQKRSIINMYKHATNVFPIEEEPKQGKTRNELGSRYCDPPFAFIPCGKNFRKRSG